VDGRLTLTVVTPERAVVPGVACDEVTLPGLEGELGVLPAHTPLITLLGIGLVTYRDGSKKTSVAVRGGFAEIAGDAVRVLADEAAAQDAIDAAKAAREKTEAEGRRAGVVGDEQLDAVNADAKFAEARISVAES
jgi:F-type H+-transporting ATPase subunit epsilon